MARPRRSPGQLTLGFDEDPRAIADELETMLRSSAPGALTVKEFGLPALRARIDVAAVSFDCLAGFEIKARRDDLARLAHQVGAFSALFDQVTLVVAACHLARAERIVPDWWGTAIASNHVIESRRSPGPNPRHPGRIQAQLLWRDEAAAVLRTISERLPRPTTRARLISELIELRDDAWLAAQVRSAIRARTSWRFAR